MTFNVIYYCEYLRCPRSIELSVVNRRACTMSCVHWPVTMPVMELYRALPEQESSTEGIVGTAAAPRVNKSR